jgi:hypothetical protein
VGAQAACMHMWYAHQEAWLKYTACMRAACLRAPAHPNAWLMTTLAVLWPTPGSASSCSKVEGTCGGWWG